MNIIYFLLPATLFLSSIFLGLFVWSVRSGQFDDLNKDRFKHLNDDER
jgi:cbb3-type cytochrome oxidase maturation protein